MTDPNGYTWTVDYTGAFGAFSTDETQDPPNFTAITLPSAQGTLTITNTTSGRTLPEVAGGEWAVLAEYKSSSAICKALPASADAVMWDKESTACWLTLSFGGISVGQPGEVAADGSLDIDMLAAGGNPGPVTLVDHVAEGSVAAIMAALNTPENEVLVGAKQDTIYGNGMTPSYGFPADACTMGLSDGFGVASIVAATKQTFRCPSQ